MKVTVAMDETHDVDEVVVVRLPREIDMTNTKVVTRDLLAARAPGVRVIVADLTSTTFCDSAGIRALAQAHQQTARSNVGLRLAVAPGGAVHRVMEIMDLATVLAIYPTVEAAVAGSSGSR